MVFLKPKFSHDSCAVEGKGQQMKAEYKPHNEDMTQAHMNRFLRLSIHRDSKIQKNNVAC